MLTVAGIPITVDLSWFVIFFLVTWSAGDLFRLWLPQASLPLVLGLGGVAALLLFASVLLHELSHSLVALMKGLKVEGITLFIFGGVSQMAREPDTPTDEVQIAIAGPALSFALSGMCLAVYLGSLPLGMEPVSALFLYLCLVNLALGIFNLVPAFPLDGGRVLRAWFWHESRSFTGATIAAARVGRTLAITLMVLGLLLALSTATLSGLWWVLIGIFLHRAASSSGEHARFKESLDGITVADVMSWSSRTVRDAGIPLGDNLAAPGEEAMAVLERMLRSGRTELPVLQDGVLVGMVTQRDILMAAQEAL
ncbi:MAG: site-2 protease family protein [Acidobacteria bacterium]|nr:site-2 protease family protein [Acidobacteriota bacterium]